MGDKEREEALALPWVELWYDPTIPAVVTNDGRRVKFIGSISLGQTASAKVPTATLSMKRMPIVMVGAMRASLGEAQDRVESYLGLPEPDPPPEEPAF